MELLINQFFAAAETEAAAYTASGKLELAKAVQSLIDNRGVLTSCFATYHYANCHIGDAVEDCGGDFEDGVTIHKTSRLANLFTAIGKHGIRVMVPCEGTEMAVYVLADGVPRLGSMLDITAQACTSLEEARMLADKLQEYIAHSWGTTPRVGEQAEPFKAFVRRYFEE